MVTSGLYGFIRIIRYVHPFVLLVATLPSACGQGGIDGHAGRSSFIFGSDYEFESGAMGMSEQMSVANFGVEEPGIPAQLQGIPASLTKVVQLASSMAGGGGGVGGDGARDGEHHLVLQGGMSPAGWTTPDSEQPAALHDSFDPTSPAMWEHISGGVATERCRSVSGSALCFDGPGSRFATTSPVNAISGGTVRFSLRMFNEDEGLPADVVLEYKAIGRGWAVMERYAEHTYDAPAYTNPNGGSLALWEGGSTRGFVLYSVNMPSEAQSAATKFRWRQLRDFVSGSFAQWAVDDVSVEVDELNPAVVLTSPSKGNRATLITVVAQFSQAVLGFDAEDVLVLNGTVVGVSHFNARILGMGELYSVMVKPEGVGDAYDVVVQVPTAVCHNSKGHPNLSSNSLVVKHTNKVKRTSRMEQALGPRPGPGDAREVAALRLHVDHKHARPHVEGHTPPPASARNTSKMFQDPEILTQKIRDAESIYKRLSSRLHNPPPRVVMEKLEKEIAVLRSVRNRLVSANSLMGKRTVFPRYRHDEDYEDYEDEDYHRHHSYGGAHFDDVMHQDMDAMHHDLHDEMDTLRKEREDMEKAMESQKEMRNQLLEERENLRKEREEARRQAAEQRSLIQKDAMKQREELRQELRAIVAEEHAIHGHGHSHDHGHRHQEGTSYADFGDDGPDSHHAEFDRAHHNIHEELEEMKEAREDLAHDLAEQRSILEAKQHLREEMDHERQERAKEAELLKAEKEQLKAEAEQAREDQRKMIEDQHKLLQELMMQQKALREEAGTFAKESEKLIQAASLGHVHVDDEHHGYEHAYHHEHDHKHAHHNEHHGETGNHTPEEDYHYHHNERHHDHDHDHYDWHHEPHHGGHEYEDAHHHDAHNAEHEAVLAAERRKMEEERKAFEAAKAELQLERERLQLEAQKELAVEKEKIRQMAEEEQRARIALAEEQRKFLQELMDQQRQLREQAQMMSAAFSSHINQEQSRAPYRGPYDEWYDPEARESYYHYQERHGFSEARREEQPRYREAPREGVDGGGSSGGEGRVWRRSGETAQPRGGTSPYEGGGRGWSDGFDHYSREGARPGRDEGRVFADERAIPGLQAENYESNDGRGQRGGDISREHHDEHGVHRHRDGSDHRHSHPQWDDEPSDGVGRGHST